MKIIKIILLQVFWYYAVSKGHEKAYLYFLFAVLFTALNYIIFRPALTLSHYIFTTLFFSIYGFILEYLLKNFGLVTYGEVNYIVWLNSLYIVFIAYYGDVFNYLSNKPKWLLSLMGIIGGIMAYYGGSKISPMQPTTPLYYVALGAGWGAFFPLSFKIFYEGFMWNKLLDASIFYSFDKSGFLRHQKDFHEDYQFPSGNIALITGGTSGIGKAVANELAKQDVQVTVTGRNQQKGDEVVKENENLSFSVLDMSHWSGIDSVVESIAPLDYLVLNAGGMPETYQTNEQGVELQFASQLFGHYYLAKRLKEKGKLKDKARIVWVTSGGMYLTKLDLSKVMDRHENYDKVATYANVKRAQVTLLPYLKEQFPNQIVTAMHPGWAATPGVSSAIPAFDKKMQGRLRTPLQGGDTILWLLSTKESLESGSFYFDRKKVKPHLFWFTKSSDKKLDELISLLNKLNPYN